MVHSHVYLEKKKSILSLSPGFSTVWVGPRVFSHAESLTDPASPELLHCSLAESDILGLSWSWHISIFLQKLSRKIQLSLLSTDPAWHNGNLSIFPAVGQVQLLHQFLYELLECIVYLYTIYYTVYYIQWQWYKGMVYIVYIQIQYCGNEILTGLAYQPSGHSFYSNLPSFYWVSRVISHHGAGGGSPPPA